MKKYFKPFEFYIDDEQRLKEKEEFNNQPKEVLDFFHIAKLFMITLIPLTSILCYFVDSKYSVLISFFLCFLFFTIIFFGFKKIDIALIPVICICLGILFGLYLLPPFVDSIKELGEY